MGGLGCWITEGYTFRENGMYAGIAVNKLRPDEADGPLHILFAPGLWAVEAKPSEERERDQSSISTSIKSWLC